MMDLKSISILALPAILLGACASRKPVMQPDLPRPQVEQPIVIEPPPVMKIDPMADVPGDKPLALIEAAIDVGQQYKPATAIARLAKRARIPAYLVLYQRSTEPNPADPRMLDVSGFRIKRLHPRADTAWRTVPPAEWATAILRIRAWAARRLDVEAANDPQY